MNQHDVRFIDAGGARIAYRRAGHGLSLVLLHGFACDSRAWLPQLAGLSDTFTVIAWDAPGAGQSTDPAPPYSIADYAGCLAAFLRALGIGKAHIAGLSWGGILAQEFYRLYPDHCQSLVLAGTYAGWRGSLAEEEWQGRLETCLSLAGAPTEKLVSRLLPGMFTKGVRASIRDDFAAIVSEAHPVGFRLMSQSSADTDTRSLLPLISPPTLLIWGEEDERSSLRIARQFEAALPNAKLAIIPHAGHVCNLEQPSAFNEHIRHFCVSA